MRDVLGVEKRIVIKVGSSSLTHETGRLDLQRIENLVKQIADLMNQGKEVILVSSGAVAAGLPALGLREKPADLPLKQAAAAVGQGILLHMYEKMFREYGHIVGQVLLTREDTVKKTHYLNVRNTLFSLLQWGILPIINENDVVSVDEFKIGDNDTLSANVAVLIEADLLIILSDIDGLYSENPHVNPDAVLISEVDELNQAIYMSAGDAGTTRGTGGMRTKLEAARISMSSGVHMVIANGSGKDTIRQVVNGEAVGTHFTPKEVRPHIKKRWVAFGKRLQGGVVIDEGCAKSILHKGSSLLPVGVVGVEGSFAKGDTVSVIFNGEEIARGLANYACHEVKLIQGMHSNELAQLLQTKASYDEVIHRDNLIVLR